jgi:hypothetical protein
MPAEQSVINQTAAARAPPASSPTRGRRNVTRVPSLLDFLAEQLADTQTAWSVGTFGAVAEFTRNAAEAATLDLGPDAISAVTARGGLRIEAHRELRPIASESLTTQSWSQRVALCLHEGACTMNGRTVLTEIGPDRDALRAEDRAAILFDLGLGALQLDACVRAGGATVVAALRRWVGHSLFGPDHTAMGAILAANPHRVFLSRVGRAEVFQPIPPPGRRSAHTCSSQAAAGACSSDLSGHACSAHGTIGIFGSYRH